MRALVVTTVHQAGDARIFERTIPSLLDDFEVTFAARPPAPHRVDHIDWRPLAGGRVRRWFAALVLMCRRRFDVVSLHDPELIPAGLVAWLLGRKVVFDLHEDVPTQMRHKGWVARPLRPVLAGLSRMLLRAAGRLLTVTLAEPGYQKLFRRRHAVFPNYALQGSLPEVSGGGSGLIYVGDVTEQRGALTMVEAAGAVEPGVSLVVVGRCPEPLAKRMTDLARRTGVELELTGNLPHSAAMERVAGSAVGLSLLHGAPNERDSMPTKVIEYLQMGVAVVASDLPGTRSAVAGLDGVSLVAPSDSAAAAAGVEEAMVIDRGGLAAQAELLRAERVWPSAEVLALYLARAGARERG